MTPSKQLSKLIEKLEDFMNTNDGELGLGLVAQATLKLKEAQKAIAWDEYRAEQFNEAMAETP